MLCRMRYTRPILLLLPALLAWGCKREAPPPQVPPQVQAVAKKVAEPLPAVPQLKPLSAPKGGKVVHLLYTSNVDGELEPCG